MIEIDGSQGEGGGQILRTSLALSLVTGQACFIHKLRAGRRKPGLLRQHLTAAEAAMKIGNATAEGAILGSQELAFRPGKVSAGDYQFSVGTAGSATLVLQTILPALILGHQRSTLMLEGGTHNPLAPPFDFLERAFLPLLNRMGPNVSAKLLRAGFYPAGGGRFSVTIDPAARLRPFDLLARGENKSRKARAMVANLPRNVGDRELKIVSEKLGWARECLCVEEVASSGPGNVLMLEIESEHVTEVFTGFGERGVRAESIAESAVAEAREYLANGAPVGEHLADQLLIPMALAGGGAFVASKVSRHTETNMAVIQQFLPVRFKVEPRESSALISVQEQ